MTGDPTIVLDIYGNNAAVICPSCGKVFVFSGFLDKKRGRVCPHCMGSRATVYDNKLSVTKH